MGGAPTGTLFGLSESGWIDAENFISWFKIVLCSAV